MIGPLEARELLVRSSVPNSCTHNGHLYYVLVDPKRRPALLDLFRQQQIGAPFHYVPLHASPGGQRYGRIHGAMTVTGRAAAGLVRRPLFPHLDEGDQERVASLLQVGLLG